MAVFSHLPRHLPFVVPFAVLIAVFTNDHFFFRIDPESPWRIFVPPTVFLKDGRTLLFAHIAMDQLSTSL